MLWQHMETHHKGEEEDFRIGVIKEHYTAFNRQVTEGVLIETNKSKYPMNRKGEFNGHRLPTLMTEVNGYINGLKRNYADETSEKPRIYKKPRVEDTKEGNKQVQEQNVEAGGVTDNKSKRHHQMAENRTEQTTHKIQTPHETLNIGPTTTEAATTTPAGLDDNTDNRKTDKHTPQDEKHHIKGDKQRTETNKAKKPNNRDDPILRKKVKGKQGLGLKSLSSKVLKSNGKAVPKDLKSYSQMNLKLMLVPSLNSSAR